MNLVRSIGEPGGGVDCEGDLAEVPSVGDLVGVRTRGLERMVSGACQHQPALLGRMAQHDPAVFGIAAAMMEGSLRKDSGLAWIVGVGDGARFIGCHL